MILSMWSSPPIIPLKNLYKKLFAGGSHSQRQRCFRQNKAHPPGKVIVVAANNEKVKYSPVVGHEKDQHTNFVKVDGILTAVSVGGDSGKSGGR